MDQLRDEIPHAGDSGPSPATAADGEAPDRELPPALGQPERRMQARAYNFWASMLRGRSLPSIADRDPERVRDFAANSVLLDVSGGAGDPAVTSLGAKLAEQCGIDAPIARLSDAPEDTLLAAIAPYTERSLTSRAPFGFESEIVNQRGATILYRGILLPFSSDERAIDFVLGTVNWKEVADPTLAAALHREFHRALARETAPPRRDEPLTEWADGPAANVEDGLEPASFDGTGVALASANEATADLVARARALAAEADAAEQRARALRDAAAFAERRAREAGMREGA